LSQIEHGLEVVQLMGFQRIHTFSAGLVRVGEDVARPVAFFVEAWAVQSCQPAETAQVPLNGNAVASGPAHLFEDERLQFGIAFALNLPAAFAAEIPDKF